MKKSKIVIFLVLLLVCSMPLMGCGANKFTGTYVYFSNWGAGKYEMTRYDVIHLNSDGAFSYGHYLKAGANAEFIEGFDTTDVGTWKIEDGKCVLTYKFGLYSHLGANNSFTIKDGSFSYASETYSKIDVDIVEYIKTHQASLNA